MMQSSDANFRSLFVGVYEHLPHLDHADFMGDETFKGYDLIVVRAVGIFSSNPPNHYTFDGVKFLDQCLTRRSSELRQQVENGLVLVIHPAGLDQVLTFNAQPPAALNFKAHWKKLHLDINLEKGLGSNLEATNAPFQEFLDELNGKRLTHRVELSVQDPFIEGLTIRGNPHVVGSAVKIGQKNGMVLFLPEPNYSILPDIMAFKSAVWNLSAKLRKNWPNTKIQQLSPEWANSFCLPGEEQLINTIQEATQRLEEINQSLSDARESLRHRRNPKRLVFAFDDELEEAVEETLSFLGFKREQKAVSNRTDGVFWVSEKSLVMEIKGKKKGAEGSNIGQVVKWKGEFFEKHGKAPDAAILLVNGWREIPIANRGIVFEKNLIIDATRERIGLLSGLQLLNLRIAVEQEIISREECCDILLTLVGTLEGYDTAPKAVDGV